jgi:hypothetical protein
VSAIRVEVTSDQIIAAGEEGRDWATPLEVALAGLTGQEVSIDGDDTEGHCIATIGQDAWTFVVELPDAANEWLDRRWDGDADDRLGSEPLAFDLEVPDWVVRFVGRARP